MAEARVLVIENGVTRTFVPEGAVPPPSPPDEEPEFPGSPPDPQQTPGTWFQIFQVHSGAAQPGQDHGEILWSFPFSRTPLADVPVLAANASWGHIPGRSRWNDIKDNPPGGRGADRVGYQGAYFFLQHSDRQTDSDTAHHDFVDAIRFHVQSYGQQNQINDRHMVEDPLGPAEPGESQGLLQYPYEVGSRPPMPVVRDHPGAVIEVKHRRTKKLANGATSMRNQLLRRIVIPATDPGNPQTKWWYQDTGTIVATNVGFVTPANPDGAIAKIVLSGVHFAYTFTVAKP